VIFEAPQSVLPNPFRAGGPAVAGVTCGAFRVRLLHLQRYFFHSRRERSEVTVLSRSADDFTFIMARNSPDVHELRTVTVHRHRPVVTAFDDLEIKAYKSP
jgi:hypothetical protein